MVVIPACYDGGTVEEWPFSINLSTVIALLTIFMRATMLFAVAEVLGHMKWRFFDRPRPLTDIQNFDHASRSVLGSARLLWTCPSSVPSVLAAVITILSMAVGPFTQQAVSNVPCSQTIPNATASLPIAHFFPANQGFRIGAAMIVDPGVTGAILNALVNPAGQNDVIQAVCETGNCSFPSSSSGVTHSSTRVCNTCFDATGFVSKKNAPRDVFNYTLPDSQWVSLEGNWFSIDSKAKDLDWAKDAFPAGFASSSATAIVNTTILSFTEAPCTKDQNDTTVCPHSMVAETDLGDGLDIVAVSCSPYPCLQGFHARVTGGQLKESVVLTQSTNLIPGSADESSAVFDTGFQFPCLLDGVEYGADNISAAQHAELTPIDVNGTTRLVPESCIFRLYLGWKAALSKYMKFELLRGNCNKKYGGSATPPRCENWWLMSLYNGKDASPATISETFDRLATTMTNIFRKTGTVNYTSFLKGLDIQDRTVGSVFRTTVCTKFDWRWVLLPIVLASATTVLLLVAVIQSCKDPTMPVWKTSVLPLLFYGVGSSDGGTSSSLDLDELHAHAGSITARFRTGSSTGFEKEPED
ncbi:hypothetical protein CSOJ01_15230 [Colletotrichum sojae]|uniref:Uncharacterized protein n=1 Tax=Colletotrichum sojae TaxID=2175907 RepID=A0A8H6IN15_9PEZI|nr:hypothetical protein CSOJ01_15230 [Colletotrichum sojae]